MRASVEIHFNAMAKVRFSQLELYPEVRAIFLITQELNLKQAMQGIYWSRYKKKHTYSNIHGRVKELSEYFR